MSKNMKMKFKVGDKVRVKKFKGRPACWNTQGKMDYLMGKVVTIESIEKCNIMNIKIVDRGRSWWLSENEIEPVNRVIVIYEKNNKVIALDKSNNEKAEARCNPADEFDFMIGAKLAFERLINKNEDKKEPEYYSGKIMFIKGDDVFKTGHIYEIKNGCIPYKDPLTGHMEFLDSFANFDNVKDFFARSKKGKLWWNSEPLEIIEVLGEHNED